MSVRAEEPLSTRRGGRVGYTVKRIVTGHDARGAAIIRTESRLRSRKAAAGYETVEVWCTNALPAVNDEDARVDGSPGERGSRALLRVGELAPGHRSPMHRSHSIDYGICLEGECELHLDGGGVVLVRAGDIVIQRGTNHAWHNMSDAPTRFAWILVDADAVRIGDATLPELMPPGHDVLSDWQPNASQCPDKTVPHMPEVGSALSMVDIDFE